MSETFLDGKVTLHCGDSLEVLAGFPDGHFDSVVCDPPYELSSDGKASSNRVFVEFMFPQNSNIKASDPAECHLVAFILKVAELRTVGVIPSPPSSMPVGAVAFDEDTSCGNKQVKDANVTAVCAPDGDRAYGKDSELCEYLGDFYFELGNREAVLNSLGYVGTGFLSGALGVGFGIKTSSLPSLFHGCTSVVGCNDDIGVIYDSLARFVGACGAAEDEAVARFDMGKGAVDTISTSAALKVLAGACLGGAKLVRAGAGASRLPTMLQSRCIRIVDRITGRAVSFNLVVHPQVLASHGFMGKAWDGSKIAFNVAMWQQIFRVLKPGGHLVAFSGTRTYHRMVCAIEDAGFEVRDMIAWMYGSGFPKSLNVSKAIDKEAGAEREKIKHAARPVSSGTFAASSDTRPWITKAQQTGFHEVDSDVPASPEAEKWQGWGTALKPAIEPICLARKPLEADTVAGNVLLHGTGGLNIDDCRVESEVLESGVKVRKSTGVFSDQTSGLDGSYFYDGSKGRWPSNVIHDGSEEVKEAFPETAPASGNVRNNQVDHYFTGKKPIPQAGPPADDGGSAARYFYEVKPDLDPICLARKPLSEDTVAENVLKHGTGGLNIDGCRVGDFKTDQPSGLLEGRWPANVVTDGSPEVVGAFPDTLSGNAGHHVDKSYGFGKRKYNGTGERAVDSGSVARFFYTVKSREGEASADKRYTDNGGTNFSMLAGVRRLDTGSVARFFYTAKAGNDDRLGSTHPTVKPIDLMQWLVRLVTPKGGLVLDHFAGTGTTGEAAYLEGMRCELIERDPTSQEDIRKRMSLVMAGPRSRKAATVKAKIKSGRVKVDDGPLFADLG